MAEVISPKKQALDKAEADLSVAVAALEVKRAQLCEVQGKLARLEAVLDQNRESYAILQAEVDCCHFKLKRAEELIGGLGGERNRWSATAKAFGEKYFTLTGEKVFLIVVVSYAVSHLLLLHCSCRRLSNQLTCPKLSNQLMCCGIHMKNSCFNLQCFRFMSCLYSS